MCLGDKAHLNWPSEPWLWCQSRRGGGAIPLEALAEVAALTGEADRAIAALQKLLSILAGAQVTPELLRLDPMFDPLRNDPRFQKLCEEKQH